MRKIGYTRGDRFFDAGPHDTVAVVVVVPARRMAELATMRVTAMSSLKYKSYHLDADDIEARAECRSTPAGTSSNDFAPTC